MKQKKSELTKFHDVARRKLQGAIRRGVIIRPEVCSACGKKPEVGQIVEAHHKDYSKPFEVVWLCGHCHKKADVKDGTNGFIVYKKGSKSYNLGELPRRSKEEVLKHLRTAGMLGAEKRWAERYEALGELSKYVKKEDLEVLRSKWKTEHLLKLLKAYKNEN